MSFKVSQVESAELKKVIAELILIGESWHGSTLNPVIFSLTDQQVLGEEKYRRV